MLTWQVQAVLRAAPGLPEGLLTQRLEHVLAPGHAKALLACMQANRLVHSARVICHGGVTRRSGLDMEPELQRDVMGWRDLVMVDGGLLPSMFALEQERLHARVETCYFVHASCSVQVVAGGCWV
jgi:hypothetical protein